MNYRKPFKELFAILTPAVAHGTAGRAGGVKPPSTRPARSNTAAARLDMLSPRARMGILKSFVQMHNDYSVDDLRELSRIADRKADEIERAGR